MTRHAPPPREPTDAPRSTLQLWAPEHWPGAPRPVVILAEDSLAALAAARWAARSASHHRTDVAIVVLVPASPGEDCTHLDDARATAARLFPTMHRYGVRSHAVVVPVARKATASASTRVRRQAVADVAAALDTPLLVLADTSDSAWTRRVCAVVPRDVLVVPAPEVHTPSPART